MSAGDSLPTDDPGSQRIDAAIEDLGEHFDTVHIIATRKDGDTYLISRGTGNWWARYGSIRDSMLKMESHITRRTDDESLDE